MSGDEIFSMVMAVFPRWETTPELIEIWRKTMSRFANVPKEIIEGTLAEHYEERDGLPEPVLKRVVDKIETKTQPTKAKAVGIDITSPEYAAFVQRRHHQQFGAIEARRREEEQMLKELSPQEFEALRLRAIAVMKMRAPDYLDFTIRRHGEDPFANATIFNSMLAEMGAVKA